ncbi:DUF6438 domain-containing protein [Tenacibaculum crassostreae]|uniref:DUF6438 domain-containing protein n=1 Tax=Tenacibaculum crassostreae TaxID=502683 RepID=UPI003893244B
MKYISLSILLFAAMCSSPKKNNEPKLVESEEKEITVKEETVEKPKVPENELIVVLKNAESINDIKSLVKNSGLTWSKMAYETDASKIGIVKVPVGKRKFWIDKLQQTDEFRLVDINTDETLAKAISEEKNNLLSIRKTPCFGECPVYSVKIDKEGNGVYNGVDYVLVKGIQEFTLSDKQLKELNNRLATKGFDSFKKVYDNPKVLDLGNTYIVHDGKQVKIRLWKDIPDELINIHEYVLDILFEKEFIE